jgi:hypothetical protein
LGKGEYPFYSLTSVSANWIGPNADGRLSQSTRFAALVRDRACVDCGDGPKAAELTVRKRIDSGCWILDNVTTVSRRCVPVELDPSNISAPTSLAL